MVKYLSVLFLLTNLLLMGEEFIAVKSGIVSITPIKREEFAPQRSYFDAQNVSLKCKIKSIQSVNIALFVKDKDGRYFQSDKNWIIQGDDSWQELTVPIDKINSSWRAFSNYAKWSAVQASGIFEIGVSFWCSEPQDITCEIKDFAVTEQRRVQPLEVVNIQDSEIAKIGKIIPIKFQLSREYFNPFDDKEIAVDCEWITPDGTKCRFPAFFTGDYLLRYAMTTEENVALGSPYWELRYLPRVAGKHKFRIIAKDTTEETISPWQHIKVEEAPFRGLIQASKNNHQFFEFENGEFFFPVGLNIHTNIDFRAEARIGMRPLADCGLKDYEEYFKRCSAAGINTIEVWMASWTFGLEWSTRRYDYYGVGRYNLANAYRLDRLLEMATEYGIFINLVWDNHGKFALGATQEWYENPFNKQSTYVNADGGFLLYTDDLFANEKYMELYKRRSRYIAARYGQNPQIFAQELWSEVDLIMNFRSVSYENKTADSWHHKAIEDYQSFTPVRHLITTHVCGDHNNNNRYLRLWELDNVTHLVGDAYRGSTIPFYAQMRLQNEKIIIDKPRLITEFGGPSSGIGDGVLEADVHAGLWASIFQKQAGTPFLWWHDFVILGDRLQHYKGLTNFIAGIDLRDHKYELRELRATLSPEHKFQPYPRKLQTWEYHFEGMSLICEDELIGWVFNTEQTSFWQERSMDLTSTGNWHGVELKLPWDFVSGRYTVDFYDTISGKVIISEELQLEQTLQLPSFEGDIAFKIRRVK